MSVLRRVSIVILLAATGCAQLHQEQTPPVPPTPAPQDGGLLLKTGAIQLGPGLGQNAWRWLGDGQAGFTADR